jgi:hypothetical protein
MASIPYHDRRSSIIIKVLKGLAEYLDISLADLLEWNVRNKSIAVVKEYRAF